MLWWLQTQQTPVIVLVVFAFCYLLAALILIALAVLSRSSRDSNSLRAALSPRSRRCCRPGGAGFF
jgi:hypothetical protein